MIFILLFGLIGCGEKEYSEEKSLLQTELVQEDGKIIEDEESGVAAEREDAVSGKIIQIHMTVPNAPNSIPFFYMQEKKNLGENIILEVSVHKSGEEAIAKTMKKEVDLAYFGVQEAAKLYNKKVPIRLLDVSTWASFELLTTREDISSWEDLKGKKLWIGDKGGPMSYLTEINLRENGLSLETDLSVNRMPIKELSEVVINQTKDIDLFVMREPFSSQVKAKNEEIKVAFDLGEEYEKMQNFKVPQGGVIVRTEFLSEQKELIKNFQKEYQEAILWVKSNPEKAALIGEKYLGGKTATFTKSINNMDMEYLSIQEAKEELEHYFELAIQVDETMLEGTFPDEEFYESLE